VLVAVRSVAAESNQPAHKCVRITLRASEPAAVAAAGEARRLPAQESGETLVMLTQTLLEAIGRTPLVPLRHVARGLAVPVLVKCEHTNTGGSVKDRIALAIVDDAERRGTRRFTIAKLSSSDTLSAPSITGTNVVAALRVAARGGLEGPVVTVLPDGWDRYRAQPWMQGW
jgi:cysteine synthase